MQNKGNLSVSLFPMFNILVCTLGVLIFILGTVGTLSLGVGKSIAIEIKNYTGSQQTKTPHYLEWDGVNLLIHPSKEKITFSKKLEQIQTYKETYQYIEDELSNTSIGAEIAAILKNTNRKYAIILVRPSGFDNFINIRAYFEHLGIDIGYEPIDQDCKIRLR